MALDFFAGCVGGCAGVIVGHPFDTVKVKLQTQDLRNPIYRGTWHCFAKILRTESVAGVYRGMSSPMAGVSVVNALVFGVHGTAQSSMSDPDRLRSHFLVGAAAGLVQSIVASPFELLKTRAQMTSHNEGVNNCLKHTLKQEGVRGLFNGLGITAARDFMGFGLYFSTYEALTRRSRDEGQVDTVTMLLAGGMSGTVSWLFTYPLDVIKTRIQADGTYSGIIDCLKKSIRAEGLSFLGKGLTPTLIRAFPTNAVTFTVVNWVFRIAELGEKQTTHFTENITFILQTLLNDNNFITIPFCLEEKPVANFKINIGSFRERPEKYFLVCEDFWVHDNSDVISIESKIDSQTLENRLDIECCAAD